MWKSTRSPTTHSSLREVGSEGPASRAGTGCIPRPGGQALGEMLPKIGTKMPTLPAPVTTVGTRGKLKDRMCTAFQKEEKYKTSPRDIEED